MKYRYVFGPVPSRRLGFSLGINNIPYKICSYSCVYCQLGRTLSYSVKRKPYGDPQKIVDEVEKVLSEKISVDYITFVPDGEPTLDSNLGRIAGALKSKFEVPIAIISNSSLIWMNDVVEDLSLFDLVSLKVDAVIENTWRRINRPHGSLNITMILQGIKDFAKIFKGKIITETMLVEKINTSKQDLIEIAKFLNEIDLTMAYVSVPIRPPSEKWVQLPKEETLVEAYNIFSRYLSEGRVSLLNMPESEGFIVHGEAKQYLLSVLNVHPLRLEYVISILNKEYHDPQSVLQELENKKLIKIISYGKVKYVVRYFRLSQE